MKKVVLIALMLCAFDAQAQWVNPSERYMDEYKKHESAVCPNKKSNIQHFVYFARDRNGIINHPFLKSDSFSGAQIMYPWAELEPIEGVYDFSKIESDLKYLEKHEKSYLFSFRMQHLLQPLKVSPIIC